MPMVHRGIPICLTCLILLAGAAVPAWAQLQPEGSGTIFRRFATPKEGTLNWQSVFEVPITLRPSTDPNAKIVENSGLNYTVSFRPGSRIFVSRSYHFGKMEWEPEDPSIDKIRVIEFGISEFLNFSIRRVAVFSVGMGLGVMDGLIVFSGDEGFRTRLEPFIPLHLGFSIPLGRRMVAGVKISQSSFFGPGPVVSLTRVLAGFGWKY